VKRVAPELFDAALQESIRTEYTRRIEEGDGRRSVAAALALGATGIRAPDGRDLCAPALAGLDELRGRALFARLVEIDARRPNDAAAMKALERVLSREDAPVGARFLALEIRARFAAPLDGPRARERARRVRRRPRTSRRTVPLVERRALVPARNVARSGRIARGVERVAAGVRGRLHGSHAARRRRPPRCCRTR
jgi:hypothetical protein